MHRVDKKKRGAFDNILNVADRFLALVPSPLFVQSVSSSGKKKVQMNSLKYCLALFL